MTPEDYLQRRLNDNLVDAVSCILHLGFWDLYRLYAEYNFRFQKYSAKSLGQVAGEDKEDLLKFASLSLAIDAVTNACLQLRDFGCVQCNSGADFLNRCTKILQEAEARYGR